MKCKDKSGKKLLPAQFELRKYASAQNKKICEWFFKTAPGQYGHGDQFIGVKIPNLRKVSKLFADSSMDELQTLISSSIHEDRMLALCIARLQYEKAVKQNNISIQRQIYQFFFKNKKQVNNWDLVDSSAPYISGHFAFHDPSAQGKLFNLIHSKSLWDRRIAMISTFYFLRQKQFNPVIELATILLKDEEDLMHKASGWMLREMGKRDVRPLHDFLDQHAHEMPRTMLRYSIEKLNELERKRYMAKKQTKR